MATEVPAIAEATSTINKEEAEAITRGEEAQTVISNKGDEGMNAMDNKNKDNGGYDGQDGYDGYGGYQDYKGHAQE